MELVFEPRQPDSESKFLLSGHPARTVSLDGVGSGTVGDPEVQWMVSGFGASVYLCSCAVLCLVTQSCPSLCNPMDCSPPGSSVHGDSPGKKTGVVAMSSFKGSSQPRDGTWVSCIAGGFFTIRATREACSQSGCIEMGLHSYYLGPMMTTVPSLGATPHLWPCALAPCKVPGRNRLASPPPT